MGHYLIVDNLRQPQTVYNWSRAVDWLMIEEDERGWGWKWMTVDVSGRKRMKMYERGCKCMTVLECENNWINWMKVDENGC